MTGTVALSCFAGSFWACAGAVSSAALERLAALEAFAPFPLALGAVLLAAFFAPALPLADFLPFAGAAVSEAYVISSTE
jgi:hypothetical protein